MTRFQLINADCRAVMANMGDESVDAIVTDPPYHLTSIVKRFGPGCAPQQFGTDGAFARAARGFMGQTWDGGDVAFDPSLWVEALRVLKPGGHILAFGGTRTYHRLAVAIEDAGFEIRDCLFWLYGSGFPKSHDIQKNGAGEAWSGWGTAVKPACEPIVMGRKPLARGRSVASNVLEFGTGALNIDGCRVPSEAGRPLREADRRLENAVYGAGLGGSRAAGTTDTGRFPANVLHDGSDEVVALFPREGGAKAPVTGDEPSAAVDGGVVYNRRERVAGPYHADQGSAARFFYCAKASRRDRDEGCEHLPPQVADEGHKRPRSEIDDPRRAGTVPRSNFHPTVKPTDLMRWLCRLITPPGGVVFDPFTGSGSTGKAALLEGFRFVGAELTPAYIPVAFARLEYAESMAA